MSKLIGTNPNQVPSNADLGTAAFADTRDFLSARGSNLSAIDKVLHDNIADVFVYDTAKDSDGGAWRKRTAHTTWYNEPLNTAIRGSRKEFPSVAIITADANSENRFVIYDADSPDLPMWMIFDVDNDAPKSFPNGNSGALANCVSACNGILALGVGVGTGSVGGGLNLVRFVDDELWVYFEYSTYHNVSKFNAPVGLRNSPVESTPVYSGGAATIISNYINDVAMKVTKHSKFNEATGLPEPTIAVATNSGVSFILEEGRTVDFNGSAVCNTVDFIDDEKAIIGQTYYGNAYVIDIPLSDVSQTDSRTNGIWLQPTGGGNLAPLAGSSSGSALRVTEKAAYSSTGLTLIDNLDIDNQDDAMKAYITSDYNTGWMPGKELLALSPSLDQIGFTSSPEIVTNGTFDTNTSGWTASTGATLSQSNGQMTVTSGTTIWNGAYQVIYLEVGKTYTITADIISSNNWGSISLSNNGPNSAAKFWNYNWNGGSTFPKKVSHTFVATDTGVFLQVDNLNTTNQTVTTVDNISVKLAEDDRTWNDKGVIIQGSVERVPVAAGSDVLAYTGFSDSSWLQQPYNESMDVGTGDFCMMAWIYRETASGVSRVMGRALEVTNERFEWYCDNNTENINFYCGDGSAYNISTELSVGHWNFVASYRKNGTYYAFVNGELVGYTNLPANFVDSSASATFNIGHMSYTGLGTNEGAGYYMKGMIALPRVFASSPTPEIIKKIYDDEKALFFPNAKATLYGTSDDVKAVAYDSTRDELHVGTSAGRSVFSGLTRVDHTTDAVEVALSASNGLVAEE